jgi:hypothetical protein
MEIIGEQKLHLIHTTDKTWQDKAKTKLHMASKGYEVYKEYLGEVDGIDKVITIYSKEIGV